MKILSTVWPLALLLVGASPAQDAEQALVHQGGLELKLMSFNIRNGTANDEDNHWNLRKDLVYQVIRDDAPDILGLQEAVYAQQEELLKELPEYAYVGTGSGGGTKGQYSSILYLKQQFKLAASGTFWLSETPFIPSRHWGSAHLRICTWARLLHRDTGHTILVYNTHLDDGSKKAREKGAAMIMKHARDHAHDQRMGRPFIVMGDFNAREDSETVALVRGTGDLAGQASIEMVDSFRALHPEQNNVGTYNGFKGDASGAKIDYIFVPASARVAEAAIVKTHQNGRYPSDHFPVTARVRFEQPASSKKGQDQDAKSSHKPDLTVPSVTDGEPAPGKRVRQFHEQYQGTDMYHALYLPSDWRKGGKYPVIVEYAGNKWQGSQGTVNECKLGYGISGGKGVIWISMPYVDKQKGRNAPTWWGDVATTVAYCKQTVKQVCAKYGGDPSKVFIAGFSRGAIACNYIGLHDDEIASLWRGFICHSHYDGLKEWGYAGSDRASAARRLQRLGERPQFISQEGSVEETMAYLKSACPSGHFTFQAMPFHKHTDTWILRDIPERRMIRDWFAKALSP